LITAGEHYGAVMNLDFDYPRYLDELKSNRFNLTRVFSGVYREVAGSFNITGNPLAPARSMLRTSPSGWFASAERRFNVTPKTSPSGDPAHQRNPGIIAGKGHFDAPSKAILHFPPA